MLLIGITTMVMAILGAAVLGGGLFGQSPHAELVYDEGGDGSVTIGLTDAQQLSASETRIRLEGAGNCRPWGGNGDLGKGDLTRVEWDDCPDRLEPGDVLQVIGSDVLLDTYMVRGPVPDHGCEAYEAELDSGDPIVIDSGEVIACDLVGDGGSRLPNDVTIENGGKLVGNMKTSGTLDIDDGAVDGDVDSTDGLDLKDHSTIEGDVTADVENVHLRDGSDVEGSITSLDSGKDVYLEAGDSSTVGGDIVSERNVDVKSDNVVEGSITADRAVWVRSSSEVGGPIEAGYDVLVDQNAVVADDITLTGSGRSVVVDDATVEGNVYADDNNVVLNDDAVIEGDVTADSVTCDTDSEIRGDITADVVTGC